MNILSKFEQLAEQAVFPSNKEYILDKIGLYKILLHSDNKEIRNFLAGGPEAFADMSRVIK